MLKRISAADSRPVTLEEAKAHCQVETTAYDDVIDTYIDAAVAYVEAETGLALQPAEFEQRLDQWPCSESARLWGVQLDLAPVRDVESVQYLDEDETLQTVGTGNWLFEKNAEGAFVWFASSYSLPSLANRPGAIRIGFVAGYNDPEASDGDPDLALPKQIRQAVLMLVAHWYRRREPVSDIAQAGVPFAVDALLGQVKIYR